MPGCRNSRGKRQEKSRERAAAYRILRGGIRRAVVEASHPNDNQENQAASSQPSALNHNPLDADLVKKVDSGVCNEKGPKQTHISPLRPLTSSLRYESCGIGPNTNWFKKKLLKREWFDTERTSRILHHPMTKLQVTLLITAKKNLNIHYLIP